MQTVPYIALPCNGTTPKPRTQTPEALCSVNLRFHVEGYVDTAQATGRGQTADEAAANLKATIDKTRAILAPQPPTLLPWTTRLGELLVCGTLKAEAKGDKCLVERLHRAFVLVLSGAVHWNALSGTYTVRSASNPEMFYTVNEESACSCPDAQKHRTDTSKYLCKHALGALFAMRLGEQEDD